MGGFMGEAFLNRVVSMFSGNGDLDQDRRILLRMITRELAQNRFSVFYRLKTEEAAPEFAGCLHEMYRQIYPLREFFGKPGNDFLLKRFCAENFMDRQMTEAARRLSPETIEKEKFSMLPEDFITRLRQDLDFLESSFYESPRRLAADTCCRLVRLLRDFAGFKFFPLLQKFDPLLRDGPAPASPKFKALKVEYIAKDIGEFLALSAPLNRGDDWKTVLKIINAANNTLANAGGTTEGPAAGKDQDLIAPEEWDALLIKIQDLHQTKILSLMVQHCLKNPVWEYKPKAGEEPAGASWFDITKTQVQGIIDQAADFLRNARIETLAKDIFGSTEITRLNHYTQEGDEIFRRKNLGGFPCQGALNYLLAFIQDHLDKEIRDLGDLVLIRGQWINIDASRETSEALFVLSGMAENLRAFDEDLSERGRLGNRLKNDLGRVDREAFRANHVRSVLNGVNAQALDIINTAAFSLTIVGKNLKNLLADYRQKNHELISNWKELESYSQDPLDRRLEEAHNRIDKTVQLLKIYTWPPVG
jgi:hypothetical protein